MKDALLKIKTKHDPVVRVCHINEITEVAELMTAFIEWKDKHIEYCKNGKSPHYGQYYLKTDGHYIEGYLNLWLQLSEIFTYWHTEIFKKQ